MRQSRYNGRGPWRSPPAALDMAKSMLTLSAISPASGVPLIGAFMRNTGGAGLKDLADAPDLGGDSHKNPSAAGYVGVGGGGRDHGPFRIKGVAPSAAWAALLWA